MSSAPAEVRYGSGSRGRVSLNARSSRRGWLTVSLLLVLSLLAASLLLLAQPAFVHAEETVRPIFTVTKPTYLPYLGQFAPKPPLPLEVRALWISRFDLGSPPVKRARLEALIEAAAGAGFNVVLLQVRATSDAYYTPGLDP